MKGNHLTDQEIQEYAITSRDHELPAIEHLRQCDVCSLKVKNYQQIVIGIKGQPKAEFPFNLSALVIAQISPKRAADSNVPFLWIAGVILLVIAGYLCGIYLSSLFPGISSMTFYLVSITASALLIFQGTALYRKYKRLLDRLDFY
jgi:hypothetical protein